MQPANLALNNTGFWDRPYRSIMSSAASLLNTTLLMRVNADNFYAVADNIRIPVENILCEQLRNIQNSYLSVTVRDRHAAGSYII